MGEKRLLRSEMLLGKEKIEILSRAHIAVFGLGGVGSFACEALARAGIGSLTIVDSDKVDETNLNRQLLALVSTVGLKKTEVMAKRIRDISPSIRVTAVEGFYAPENREEFFREKYDYLIDAIDTVTSKADLIRTALSRGIPVASAMGTGNKFHPELFEIGKLSETDVCPLCKKMRSLLKAEDLSRLTVVYSKENPKSPLFFPEEGRRPPGSVSFVPPVAGMLLASVAVRALLGIG